MSTSDHDLRAINTLRVLSADTVSKANSGHPGAPMGMAPIAYVLWTKYLKQNPLNSKWVWVNRDRFVLSNGHACALLYSLLYLSGHKDYTLDDLKSFRQLDSKTPGHPENHFPGVEVSTGPLGQGISNAVGLAIAEAHLRAHFNKPGFPVIDHYTYVFCGDGCLQEGISSEAGSLAGHLGLGKLIVFYDDNHITIDGETELSFTEDVLKRYEAYGWHVQHVKDGNNDITGIAHALEAAQKVHDKPSIIKVTTTIGFGSGKQGTEAVHGNPLSKDDLAHVKKLFGFDSAQAFVVPEDVKKVYDRTEAGRKAEADWQAMLGRYAQEHKDLAAEFQRRANHQLPAGWEDVLPKFTPKDAAAATRKSSQACILALGKVLPELMGGSADLNPSCFTYLEYSKDFQHHSPEGRNLRFGVREHAMCAVVNGLAAYGMFIPYGSTFLNFIGYAWGSVLLSALSGFRALFIMTHDSIGLGEDGPTHQAIEKLMLVRTTPNILLLRPADGNETAGAYITAIRQVHRPSVLALTRQNVPQLEGSSREGVFKGAYVLQDAEGGKPDIILTGSGSEVPIAVEAKLKLKDVLKVRVVSFPSWELFEEQPLEYRESVFLPGVPVVSIEAGSVTGWQKYAHASVGMTTFGASGPYQQVYKKFGLTAENLAEKAKVAAAFYKQNPVPNLLRKPW